jgi:hypothetical protein
MDDASGVSGGQAACDLDAALDGLSQRQPAVAETVAQRLAVEQLGHDEGRAVVAANVECRENVRVIQRRRGSRFLLEALQAIGIGRERRREHLDGDVGSQPRIARAIHLAHAAGADGADDFVRTEPCTGLEGHGGLSRRRTAGL